MKSLMSVFVMLMTATAAGAAVAGELAVEPTDDSMTAPLILLAMLGVVILSGSGMLSSRSNTDPLDINADDAEDEANF